jgi:hypothetical protein
MKNLFNYYKIFEKKEQEINNFYHDILDKIYNINELDHWLQEHNLMSLPIDPRLEILNNRVYELLQRVRRKIDALKTYCNSTYENHKKDCVILLTVHCYFDVVSGKYAGCGRQHIYFKAYKYHGHKKNFYLAKEKLVKLINNEDIIREAVEDAKNYEKQHPELKYCSCDRYYWAKEHTIDNIHSLSFYLDPKTEDITDKIML